MQSHIASRLFSTLLAFVLAASLVPHAAWAQDATPPTSPDATALTHTAPVASDEAAPTSPDATVATDVPLAVATLSEKNDRGKLSVQATPSENENRLAAAVAALQGLSFYRVNPRYGVDTNINTLLSAKLQELGYGDVGVGVQSVVFSGSDPAASAGISAAQDATNGAITYFYLNPDEKTAATDWSILRQFEVVFALSVGEATATWTPASKSSLPWDVARVESLLEQQISQANLLSCDAGQSPEALCSDVSLLAQANGKTWAPVTWKSSDTTALKIVGNSWAAKPYVGKVTRSPLDKNLTLTAEISFNQSQNDTIALTKTFDVTVKKKDDATLEQTTAALTSILKKITPLKFTDAETQKPLVAGSVVGDVLCPTPRSLGLDGKYYKLSYAGIDDSFVVSGYRAAAYRPLPGTPDSSTKIKATLSYEGITVTRDIGPFTLKALQQQELDSEVALMDKVKASYSEGIRGENASVDAIAKNMHAFQEAHLDADGNLVWVFSSNDQTGGGIVPVDLAGYDPMGSAGWRLFKSGRPDIITHENLLVQQPQYNTSVTIESCLSSQKYAAYAQRYPDNAQFAQLARQSVLATVRVAGTTGLDAPAVPEEKCTVTCRVIGKDAKGAQQVWVANTERKVSVGSDAASMTKAVLDGAGCTYDAGLFSITSADGTSLAWDPATGAWWQFYVNGRLADKLASNTILQPGDEVVWYYSAGDTLPPSDTLPPDNTLPPNGVVVVPDAPRPNYDSAWPGFGNAGGSLNNVATPTEASDLAWTQRLKQSTDWNTQVSDPLVVNGDIYIAVGNELRLFDAETGKLKKSAPLAAAIESTCRMVYAQGVIVVPLAKGRLQALTADALTTTWLTDALPDNPKGSQQPLTTLSVAGGSVYFGTAAADWNTSYGGYYVCVNLATGALRWSHENKTSGYYWAGGAVCGNYLIVADDAGTLTSYDAETGSIEAAAGRSEQAQAAARSLSLGASVRSSVVANAAGTEVYVADKVGVLHKVGVAADGSLTDKGSVKFAASSTSTPALANGKLYVGGATAAYKGVFAVIDTEQMRVEDSVETLGDGSVLPGQVQSSPLVSVQAGAAYAYFTCNAKPGGVYCYSSVDKSCILLFAPEAKDENYCMASIVAGADGVLYYTNDSGNLFALKSAGKKPVDPPVPGTPDVPGGGTPGVAPGAPGAPGGAAAAPAVATTVPPAAVPVSAPVTAAQEKQAAVEAARGEAVPLMAGGEARAMAVGSDNGGGVADQGQRGD
ncbi:MAG: DUF4430 domain-containing protein, partial [Raoultibacter sp.]